MLAFNAMVRYATFGSTHHERCPRSPCLSVIALATSEVARRAYRRVGARKYAGESLDSNQLDRVHRGIVIHSYMPYKKKVIMLDHNLGKIEALPDNSAMKERLVHGAFIEYRCEPWHHMYALQDSAYIDFPAAWVDLLFLHHILEMSNYFLVAHCNVSSVFEHFMNLYKPFEHAQIYLAKKIFVCRFFSLLGICPYDALDYDSHFFNLISGHIDIMLSIQKVDTIYLEKKIDRWLLGCIQTHPHAHMLKTINFITNNEQL